MGSLCLTQDGTEPRRVFFRHRRNRPSASPNVRYYRTPSPERRIRTLRATREGNGRNELTRAAGTSKRQAREDAGSRLKRVAWCGFFGSCQRPEPRSAPTPDGETGFETSLARDARTDFHAMTWCGKKNALTSAQVRSWFLEHFQLHRRVGTAHLLLKCGKTVGSAHPTSSRMKLKLL